MRIHGVEYVTYEGNERAKLTETIAAMGRSIERLQDRVSWAEFSKRDGIKERIRWLTKAKNRKQKELDALPQKRVRQSRLGK